jgi:hypothetical protein
VRTNNTVRSETDKAKLEAFMAALGDRVRGPGRIYHFCRSAGDTHES